MSTDEFNLKREIRDVIRGTDLASPEEISAKVLENVPESAVWEALAQALPDLVRIEVARERARPATAARPATPTPTADNPARASHGVQSAKVREIREHWQRHLRDRISVGRDTWLMLADCTAGDLRVAAEERRARADRMNDAADRYSRYADVCEEHKVARFGLLPKRVLADLFRDQVAA